MLVAGNKFKAAKCACFEGADETLQFSLVVSRVVSSSAVPANCCFKAFSNLQSPTSNSKLKTRTEESKNQSSDCAGSQLSVRNAAASTWKPPRLKHFRRPVFSLNKDSKCLIGGTPMLLNKDALPKFISAKEIEEAVASSEERSLACLDSMTSWFEGRLPLRRPHNAHSSYPAFVWLSSSLGLKSSQWACRRSGSLRNYKLQSIWKQTMPPTLASHVPRFALLSCELAGRPASQPASRRRAFEQRPTTLITGHFIIPYLAIVIVTATHECAHVLLQRSLSLS